MKIVLTLFYNINASDGTVVRALRVADLLKAKHEVTIISRKKKVISNNTEISNVILRSIVRSYQSLLWNIKLSYLIILNKFDVIYCANDYFGFPSIFLWSKIKKYRVIYEAHSILSEDMRELKLSKLFIKLNVILEKYIIKHSHYVVALSPNTYEYYSKYNSKIVISPVFIEEQLFLPAAKSTLKSNLRMVGLIGPFLKNSPRKMENLLFLYKNINSFDSRIHFVIIGQCPEKLDNKGIEYTGYLTTIEEYINHLHRLDAVLVPEITATTGPLNKIIEPMACSIPVFTTPKGVMGLYWVKQGEDIIVAELNNLVDVMNKEIFNDDLMTEIGSKSRKIIEKYYSKQSNEEILLGIMDSLS